MTPFGQRMWVALIIVGGLQLMSTLTTAADVPDVNAVITLKSFLDDRWRKDPKLYCITGDKNTTITTHNRPGIFDLLRFTGPALNKTAEYNADGDVRLPWGVVCKELGNHNNYDVAVPLRFWNRSHTPTKLSYTLDPDQDLVINVRDAVNSTDGKSYTLWKEGDVGTRHLTNINNGRVTIPHQQLHSSGIYALGYISTRFSLCVRECTSGRYGPNCTKHCPDCRNGGMCHSQTGHCVCPPGVMGSLCQTPCPLNLIGKHCTVRVPYTAGVAVCVPHPVGCTCLPGYQGMWCEEECNIGHWGGDCLQHHGTQEDICDETTCFCNHEYGEFVYQVIVGFSVLVNVGMMFWCCWSKRKQQVAPRPTEKGNEPDPSASVASRQPDDLDGPYLVPALQMGPVPVTIRNHVWTVEQDYDDVRVASVPEPQTNEEEHIYEDVKDFLVGV